MKTTLDLPDDLLLEAKAVAVQRRTTLKAIIEHALRREIRPAQALTEEQAKYLEVGPLGMIRLKRIGPPMTPAEYQTMVERIEQAEDERYLPRPS